MTPKPYSESCVQNQEAIWSVIEKPFSDRRFILEIGSGTGQHAVYFSRRLPRSLWQTSDLIRNHAGIQQWLADENLPNILPPLDIDAGKPEYWPNVEYDAVFSANAVHIMGWDEVVKMFQGVGRVLAPRGLLCLYGPFNYAGKFTSESNERFDAWLKANDPRSGIREFEALNILAAEQEMNLESDCAMPANNRTLFWRKS